MQDDIKFPEGENPEELHHPDDLGPTSDIAIPEHREKPDQTTPSNATR